MVHRGPGQPRQEHLGLPGVAWLFGALYLALFVGTYLSCRRHGRPSVAAVPVALLVLAAAPALSARPQVVSLVLLTVTVAAWLGTLVTAARGGGWSR